MKNKNEAFEAWAKKYHRGLDLSLHNYEPGHTDYLDDETLVARDAWLASAEARTNPLTALLSRCKCGVYLNVNEHRDYYETAEQRLKYYADLECPPEISDEIREAILQSGNIVELRFYPSTPISFYHIVHHDLDVALLLAHKYLDKD